MYLIYLFICLFTELLCSPYFLAFESTINPPSSSDSESFYIKRDGLPEKNGIYILFIISNGKMDLEIDYSSTSDYQRQDLFPGTKKSPYKIEEKNGQKIYIYEFWAIMLSDYLVIKYSGFSGDGIKISCAEYSTVAQYIPRGNITNLSPSIKYAYIYLNYSDFPYYKDIYVNFKIHEGTMNYNIKYQETNKTPDTLISFDSNKEKRGYTESLFYPDKYYFFDFYNSGSYKYLLIFYTLYFDSYTTISASSSIKIQRLSKKTTLKLDTIYNSGYLFLKISDFNTPDDIYIYFTITHGEMNKYYEYKITDIFPNYEEYFPSLEKKDYDNIEHHPNGKEIYIFTFKKDNYNYHHYPYLVIKYSGFSGKDIEISSSTTIKYLPKNAKINITDFGEGFGYIFLNYSDFSRQDNTNKIYLYFTMKEGYVGEEIYYENSNTYPIYEDQFSSLTSKKCDIDEITVDYKKYIHVIDISSSYNYLIIRYSSNRWSSLSIFDSSIDLMAKKILLDSKLTLSSSKTGFIFLRYYDLNVENDFFIYFEVSGRMDSNISYIDVNNDPSYGDYYTSFKSKNCDIIDEESNPKIYCYKFSKYNKIGSYLLIKYSGFSGYDIKVSFSEKNPFDLSTTAIVLISIGSVIVVGVIITLIIIFIYKKKKKVYIKEDLFEDDDPEDIN